MGKKKELPNIDLGVICLCHPLYEQYNEETGVMLGVLLDSNKTGEEKWLPVCSALADVEPITYVPIRYMGEMIGLIYTSHKNVRKKMGWSRITKNRIKTIKTMLAREISRIPSPITST